ncbi:hypothetical protein FRC00_007071 [Tulasnella sp. 408]|nr:hypothetical protein FRC00_007071 [Tulasnella sp. 408]
MKTYTRVDPLARLNRDLILRFIFSFVLDPRTYEFRGDPSIWNVGAGLWGLGFQNILSKRVASWAVIKYGVVAMTRGFFKYSQAVAHSGEVVAPLILASHLLAAKELHSSLIDINHVHVYCTNLYWGEIRKDEEVPARSLSTVVINFIDR